jgi:hypothetical protein
MTLDHIEPDLRPLARPIEELLPDPYQAQDHDGRSIAEITRSLREHGQCKPVVVERATGHVKAGNGTLEAARGLGWTHLAAVMSDAPEADLRLFALRDNRSAQYARWNPTALLEELEALGEMGAAPADLGWTDADMETLVEALDASMDDAGDGLGFDDVAVKTPQSDGPPGTVPFKFGQYSAYVSNEVYQIYSEIFSRAVSIEVALEELANVEAS